MNNKQNAISLFRYIKELYAQKQLVISDIKRQEWVKYLSEIPVDDKYIFFYNKTNQMEENVILKVQKPDFEKCPLPPSRIKKWLEEGWESPKVQKVGIKRVEGEAWSDDPMRDKYFENWNNERKKWLEKQKKLDSVRVFFQEMHKVYVNLERDSEAIELMAGQGILECQLNYSKVYHPILLKRLSMDFDAKNNTIRILDTHMNTEIYTSLLQGINFIDHNAVKNFKEKLTANEIHPFQAEKTCDYLKEFVHRIHSDGQYIDDIEEKPSALDKLVVYNAPMLFIRKKAGGVLQALDQIIEHIEETEEVTESILNLLGENTLQQTELPDIPNLPDKLAALKGEDKDTLLTKEANREQLEIAKRIAEYNAVLVQGPPGTGKTHTIANLMGHFLSQGKNVLVTSHTKKALLVVKDKVVPELQNLCVSLLDDNSKDMEAAVDGITEYISSHTSMELKEAAEDLEIQRQKILGELNEVRQHLYEVKYEEYKPIPFNGKEYTPSEAARFVHDNEDKYGNIIPGEISLQQPIPMSMTDIERLYAINGKLSMEEEAELNCQLPSPDTLITPDEFRKVLNEGQGISDKQEALKTKLSKDFNIKEDIFTSRGENVELSKLEEVEKELLASKKELGELEEWMLYAMSDGKKGGGYRRMWRTLLETIAETDVYSNEAVPLLLGNKVSIACQVDENLVGVLEEMKGLLSNGKKITWFNMVFNRPLGKAFGAIKVNGKPLATDKDCSIVIAYIELNVLRAKLKMMWDELITHHGGLAYESFGEAPEQGCKGFSDKIRKSAYWYDKEFREFKEKAIEIGVSKGIFFIPKEFASPVEEIAAYVDLIYTILPSYVKVIKMIHNDLPDLIGKVDSSIETLEATERSHSSLCTNMRAALKSMDLKKYNAYYESLCRLYEKYEIQQERKTLLQKLAEFAPQWSKAIEKRNDIHGMSAMPKYTEGAIKWKYFYEMIDEITKLPFEGYREQAEQLNEQLKETTIQLSESLSWYHLLCRIEADVTQKQALQGWKLTQKKIGKGTGKSAPALKREAQELMAKCQRAVPAWIMPINKALESLNPTDNKFDVVIVDEASQSDLSALAILYLGKKVIIVGDDEQVSPSAVGIDLDQMANLASMYITKVIPNAHLYDMKTSLYDIAKTTFPTLMLKEHFRCVPSIIGFNNMISYDYKIKPLRDESSSSILPAMVSLCVNGVRENKINGAEGKAIAALLCACLKQPEYKGMTFGIISLLGDEQAEYINNLILSEIDAQEYEERNILCGNASHFQGDERDVMFLSIVDSNEEAIPLRLIGEGVGNSIKQRYNVAVSRARNQVWVVHSLDPEKSLREGDIRKTLIEYAKNPDSFRQHTPKRKIYPHFQTSVAEELANRGYTVVPGWEAGAYTIDMVIISEDKKIALECDGGLRHTGKDKINEDMERQAILERLGWKFLHIRGSEYYRNPEDTIKQLVNELRFYGIKPSARTEKEPVEKKDDLKNRVMLEAKRIIAEWSVDKDEESDASVS